MKPENAITASDPAEGRLNRLAKTATSLGREIVEVSGFLEQLDHDGRTSVEALDHLTEQAAHVIQINAAVAKSLTALGDSVERAFQSLDESHTTMRTTGEAAAEMRAFSIELGERQAGIQPVVDAVQSNNEQILAIATQVNMLAINAKIEAARAGEAGRGFSVVADAINELSQRTGAAAQDVTSNVLNLIEWLDLVREDARKLTNFIADVSTQGEAAHRAIEESSTQVGTAQNLARQITGDAETASEKLADFAPAFEAISDRLHDGSKGISSAARRIAKLIDRSEMMVQDSSVLGGSSRDAPFIDEVRRLADAVSEAFNQGIERGEIDMTALFDRRYRPVPGTDPQQHMARFTGFTDRCLPPIQEPALNFDDRVIFCAAVDTNGYLPTHNRKFSQKQGNDPVWNTSNARNQRIFNDRVGLKAGRNTEPFLLQVYRRDMGGGEFAIMKDLSAPIFVRGRHWGGLRLAYRF